MYQASMSPTPESHVYNVGYAIKHLIVHSIMHSNVRPIGAGTVARQEKGGILAKFDKKKFPSPHGTV